MIQMQSARRTGKRQMQHDKCKVTNAMWLTESDNSNLTNATWQRQMQYDECKCYKCIGTNVSWKMQCDKSNMKNITW